jgi:hypothetical protein
LIAAAGDPAASRYVDFFTAKLALGHPLAKIAILRLMD